MGPSIDPSSVSGVPRTNPQSVAALADRAAVPSLFKDICIKCGRGRAKHDDSPFGPECGMDTCGKCGVSEERHLARGKVMGAFCTLGK
mmetsp:Transcript_37017/g.110859  ORF Transcript_37017/g.110859 Transcript_37017/m.110859 type:complete len:88 (-) Transcript_37017:184-447(-)